MTAINPFHRDGNHRVAPLIATEIKLKNGVSQTGVGAEHPIGAFGGRAPTVVLGAEPPHVSHVLSATRWRIGHFSLLSFRLNLGTNLNPFQDKDSRTWNSTLGGGTEIGNMCMAPYSIHNDYAIGSQNINTVHLR